MSKCTARRGDPTACLLGAFAPCSGKAGRGQFAYWEFWYAMPSRRPRSRFQRKRFPDTRGGSASQKLSPLADLEQVPAESLAAWRRSRCSRGAAEGSVLTFDVAAAKNRPVSKAERDRQWNLSRTREIDRREAELPKLAFVLSTQIGRAHV